MTAKPRTVTIDAAIAVTLVLLTIVCYAAVRNHEFVAIDDMTYVVDNQMIHDGLSRDMVKWALTTGYAGNWHPLTWVSHAIDCKLFGVSPGPHHLVNLGFHCLNTVLLFIAVRWMTGERWASAFVAALFALHPLHVESVAWVSERKDVLSTLFWMLTLLAYIWYARRVGWLRYGLVFVLLAIGLMAKPMLVTLPLVLLLLDFWPLRRYAPEFNSPWQAVYLAFEKVPLLALSAICSVLTVKMQSSGAAVASLELWPLPYRLGNAAIATVTYLQDMLWPSGLAYFYPLQKIDWQSPWHWLLAFTAVSILGLITLVAILFARGAPYVLVGWLWYLITLVPVIGIVQVGQQARADRYMYIPMIGPAIILAWLGLTLSRRSPKARVIVSILALTCLAICIPLTMRQVLTWRNSEAMYTRGIEATEENGRAHTGLGTVRQMQGQLDEAIRQYKIGAAYQPMNPLAYHRLGVALALNGEWVDAEAALRLSFTDRPELFRTRVALARVYVRQNRLIEAGEQYALALEHPQGQDLYEAEFRRLAKRVQSIDARIAQASELMQSNPNQAEPRYQLAWALYDRGQLQEAERQARIATSLRRDWADPHSLLAMILRLQKEYSEAAAEYQQSLELSPRAESTRKGLRDLLAFLGEHPEIEVEQAKLLSASRKMLELEPMAFEAHWMLGRFLADDDPAQAIEHYRMALEVSEQRPLIAAELAELLATTKNQELRDGPEALRLARNACEAVESTNIVYLKALAAAQAETGDNAAAARTIHRALRLARLREDEHEERRLLNLADRYANR